MQRIWFSTMLAAAPIGAACALAAGARAATQPLPCAAFAGGPAGATTAFSGIEATGVSCDGARQVLTAFADGGLHPGAYLGYSCRTVIVVGKPGEHVICKVVGHRPKPKQVTGQATKAR